MVSRIRLPRIASKVIAVGVVGRGSPGVGAGGVGDAGRVDEREAPAVTERNGTPLSDGGAGPGCGLYVGGFGEDHRSRRACDQYRPARHRHDVPFPSSWDQKGSQLFAVKKALTV
ncbi:hypothetical protein [Streptomyces vastus]|uniref:Uncharacterized protein n=1 Tax=Streptomyces vastus TaxID=285451 RepID=A0ABN3S080_9ACTN